MANSSFILSLSHTDIYRLTYIYKSRLSSATRVNKYLHAISVFDLFLALIQVSAFAGHHAAELYNSVVTIGIRLRWGSRLCTEYYYSFHTDNYNGNM